MAVCAVCSTKFVTGNYNGLAEHLIDMVSAGDFLHISWINRNISKNETGKDNVSIILQNYYNYEGIGLKKWIIYNFIRQFRGESPHPFILKMQTYNPEIMKGYAVEHYFFLKQWVRSCASVISKTGIPEIQNYELENILSEFYGTRKKKAHIELLLLVAEHYGISRNEIYSEEPLAGTKFAIERWKKMAISCNWIQIMAAMHSLELVANRDLSMYGAKIDYFNPGILKNEMVPDAVKNFLREGYEKDVSHSFNALDLVEKYSVDYDVEDIQDAYILSSYAFGIYLESRIRRGEIIENKQ
jgi:pyrroloquinoline-quinone synthase